MVNFLDVKYGKISLVEIVEINHFLDMKSDIEYANMPSLKKGGKQYGSSRINS